MPDCEKITASYNKYIARASCRFRIRATPHNSERAYWQEIRRTRKLRKRRNNWFISSFRNAARVVNFRQDAANGLCGVAFTTMGRMNMKRSVRLIVCFALLFVTASACSLTKPPVKVNEEAQFLLGEWNGDSWLNEK